MLSYLLRSNLGSLLLKMNDPVHVGLAVGSNASSTIPAEAKMSQGSLGGDWISGGQFIWSEDIGFKTIVLPDK